MRHKPEFASCTDKGKVRAVNEDVCGYFQTLNGFLLIVCDGMGGHARGDLAASTSVRAIAKTLSSEYFENPVEGIHIALQNAHQEICAKVAENPDLEGMGTTAVVALVRETTLYYGHIGDSRIYLFNNEILHRLTKDHSFVQMLVDAGTITEAEAENHPKRNIILKAIGGTKNDPELASEPILLLPKYILLLCTDGLTTMVTDSEISNVLSVKYLTLQQKATLLTELALDAGGVDNISLQLFCVQP